MVFSISTPILFEDHRISNQFLEWLMLIYPNLFGKIGGLQGKDKIGISLLEIPKTFDKHNLK